MAWRNPINQWEGLAPIVHSVENTSYTVIRQLPAAEIKARIKERMTSLYDMWGKIRGWWVSGSVLTALRTNTYPRDPTNLDVAVLWQKGILTCLIGQAKKNNLLLCRRTKSYKRLSGTGRVKQEDYVPYDVNAVLEDCRMNRNYQFCLVNPEASIEVRNDMYDRIKLYPHLERKETLVSTEDNLVIDPRWLSNDIVFPVEGHRGIYGVRLEYLLQIQERLLKSWRWRWNPKHRQDRDRILKYFEAHPSERLPSR
jgi:hypothetical protein